VPLWRGDHVAIKQLVEDFARYIYLPRLKEPSVLLGAIRDGLVLLTWQQDAFAYAESFDEASGRYRGLHCGQLVNISTENLSGLLVRPEPAIKQLETEKAASPVGVAEGSMSTSGDTSTEGTPVGGITSGTTGLQPVISPKPKRFHGSVPLDPTRVGRDASRIADEVLAHLVGLVGSTVKVSLEIEVEIPSGAPDNVVRTVTENSRTLKFTSQGFEAE
jgi:hypothetical protein